MMTTPGAVLDSVSKDLLDWYDRERRVLPWREEPGPYRTWISEVMLQQTRVDTVLPYFERFMTRFPTVEELAAAEQDEVLSMWSGLGYYSRARNMHKAAKMVANSGSFPFDIKGLRELPGVGEYMAAAIASIALGQDVATVDGNIARVMARLHADAGARSAMWKHAESHLPVGRAGDYNQALMDLGARICIPRKPRCGECPVHVHCSAHEQGRETEFPPAKKKRAVPEVWLAGVLVRGEKGYLLGQRKPDGLWGGLYEPPMLDSAKNQTLDEIALEWRKQFGVELEVRSKGVNVRHVLTHRIIHVHTIEAQSEFPKKLGRYLQLRWVQPEGLSELGVSALTKRLLAQR
jgi:A/G-specific adenine glycosylase